MGDQGGILLFIEYPSSGGVLNREDFATDTD